MTQPQIILFAIFAAVVLLMVVGKWRYDLVAFAGLVTGVLVGLVPADEAFTGFANPATVSVTQDEGAPISTKATAATATGSR